MATLKKLNRIAPTQRLRDALINRWLREAQPGEYRFGADCPHTHVYKSRCVRCLRIVLVAACAAILAASVTPRADGQSVEIYHFRNGILTCVGCDPSRGISFGYSTYAGLRALVTIEQIKQAKEKEAYERATAGTDLRKDKK